MSTSGQERGGPEERDRRTVVRGPAVLPEATRAWVESRLASGETVAGVVELRGGITSEIRRLDISGPGEPRPRVLRTFTDPFFLRHAEGLLGREAQVLGQLRGGALPVPEVLGVDAKGEHCARPSLLMSLLPGRVRLEDEGAGQRAEALARQLVLLHRLSVEPRPRTYQAWTSAERVEPPSSTHRAGVWRRAVDVIRREPPPYRGCFLHRDFHPGNVLFDTAEGSVSTGAGAGARTRTTPRITGIVDWVETSWGPADLDVAHCATNLALLHGPEEGMRFADRYRAAGGVLDEDPQAHLYWRLLDALAFVPQTLKVSGPWRELGRADLTGERVSLRLEGYLQALLHRYAG